MNNERNKVKEFFCELFGTHKWKAYEYLKDSSGSWVLQRCKRCGKKRKIPQPVIMIPSVFSLKTRMKWSD